MHQAESGMTAVDLRRACVAEVLGARLRQRYLQGDKGTRGRQQRRGRTTSRDGLRASSLFLAPNIQTPDTVSPSTWHL